MCCLHAPAGCRHLLAITNRRDITIVAASRRVVIGADTHRDTNHLAVLTVTGKPLADAEFPTNPVGYDDALRWARSPCRVDAVNNFRVFAGDFAYFRVVSRTENGCIRRVFSVAGSIPGHQKGSRPAAIILFVH